MSAKGKDVIGDIMSLLNTPVRETSMDIKHLSFEPLLSPATFQDADSVGYVKVRLYLIPCILVPIFLSQSESSNIVQYKVILDARI